MSWKPRAKAIAKWTALVVGVLLFLAGLLFGLLQTRPGKRYLAARISSALSARPDVRVRLGHLEGLIPFSVRLGRLDVGDTDGEWLHVENVALNWSPARLVRGQVHILQLTASGLSLERLPTSGGRAGSGEMALPTWPPPLPSLIVERFAIERLILGEAVVGERAAFTMEGRIRAAGPAEGTEASWRLERTDGPRALARVTLALRGDPPSLILDARAEEPRGGLLSRALKIATPGPVVVALHGEGPIEAWKGRLEANGPSLGAVEADLALRARPEPALTAEGRVRIDPALLPRGMAPLLGDENHFWLTTGFRSKDELMIEHLKLDTGRVLFELKGGVRSDGSRLHGDFSMGVHDLSVLEALAGDNLAGTLQVKGALSGSLRQPHAGASIKLDNVGVAKIHMSRFEGNFQVEPLGPLSSSFIGVRVRGNGNVHKPTYPGLEPFPEEDIGWVVDIDLPPRGDVSIHQLEASGKNLSLSLAGRLNPASSRLSVDAAIHVRDLRSISAYWGAELAGATRLKASLEGDGKARDFSARISGRLTDHLIQIGAFAPLLGRAVDYAGNVEFTEGKTLRISGLRLGGEASTLTGDASLQVTTRELKGLWHLAVPRLRVLSVALGQRIDGSLEMDGEVQGSLSSPKVTIDAMARDLLVQDIPLGRLRTMLRVEGLPGSPRGRLQLELHPAGPPVYASGGFSLDGDRLSLSDLSVKGAGTTVNGDLIYDLSKQQAKGTLRGQAEDLSRLSGLWGQRVGGSGSFRADLSPGKRGQEAVLDVHIAELDTVYAKARALDLSGHLWDLFGAPKGEAKVKASALKAQGLTLTTMTLTAGLEPPRTAFSLRAQGRLGEPFELKAEGALRVSGEDRRLELQRFEGRYEKYPLALARPTALERTPEGYRIKDLSLKIGPGTLKASGGLGAEVLDVTMVLNHLPLEALRLFGSPALSGALEGRIRMTGKPDRPDAEVELLLDEVRSRVDTLKDLPPATLRANAELRKGLFRADLSVEGLSEKPVEGRVQLPVRLSISPFVFGLPPGGELGGQLKADVDLARIPTLFSLEDQSLRGRLKVDVALSGKPETPEISGVGRIEHAAYENTRTGTILRDIDLNVRAGRDRLLVEEARATDGGTGRISAKGRLDLLPGQGYPLEAEVDLMEATLVRQDAVTARANGRVRLSGSLSEALVDGKLTIGPAEIRIPDRLPPDVAELQVVEINRPGEESRPRPAEQVGRPHGPSLDLQVESPGRVFVRGRGLDSEWEGSLHIRGSAAEPSITGSLSVVRGRYNLFGQRFTLTKGDISFAGASPPNPNIDVTAEDKKADMTARVRLTGTPSALKISLESDPSMPPDEIMARVLFGKGAAEVTPVQALKLAQAMNTLAGGGRGLDFMDFTRRIMHVDQLDVRPSSDDQDETSVSIGKYLMDEVYVEVEKEIEDEGGEVSVGVEVTPNISVEVEGGTDGQGGAGIFWKRDY